MSDHTPTTSVQPSAAHVSPNANEATVAVLGNRFSKRNLIIFAVLFGALGVFFIWRSFAAQPVVASVEAEQLTLATGATAVADTSASGGQYVKFTSKGPATYNSLSLVSQATTLTIRARGDQCTAPNMEIKIDGRLIKSQAVSSSTWADYTISTSVAAGSHNLSVEFTNPTTQTAGNSGKLKCRSNLYIDKFVFYGPDNTPTNVVEVAKGKPTLASSTSADGYGRMLQPWYGNDGSSTTTSDGVTPSRWASSFLDNQWWQVDLGSNIAINRVDVNWETAYASHYKVQGSTDGSSFTDLADVTLTAAGLKSSTFNDASVRYVRIYGLTRATQWGFSIWDVQVYSGSGTGTTPDSVTAAIKTPINGSTVSGGVPVEATATSSNGISKVEFYLDSTLTKTETVAPYCMANDSGVAPCYNWNSATVPNGTHTITAYAYDTAGTKSAAATSTFTVNNATVPTGSSPSGVPMPVGNYTDSSGHTWTQVFTDDFTTDVAADPNSTTTGGFLSNAAYSGKWTGYTQHIDTFGTGWYCPSKVVSVSGGILNKYLHHDSCGGSTTSQTRLVSALLPKAASSKYVNSAGQTKYGQQYGRYIARFKTDPLANFYMVWLLWPDSENWPTDGETDWPEASSSTGMTGTMRAFLHKQGATTGGDQTYCDSGKKFFDPTAANPWHTIVTEWLPGRINIIADGALVCTSTDRIPNTKMHWVLQTETGKTPDNGANGNLQVDWVAAYQY